MYRVTHLLSKISRWLGFGMFGHPAWAVGSYRCGPSAAGTVGTRSSGGFYRADGSPCTVLHGLLFLNAWYDTLTKKLEPFKSHKGNWTCYPNEKDREWEKDLIPAKSVGDLTQILRRLRSVRAQPLQLNLCQNSTLPHLGQVIVEHAAKFWMLQELFLNRSIYNSVHSTRISLKTPSDPCSRYFINFWFLGVLLLTPECYKGVQYSCIYM